MRGIDTTQARRAPFARHSSAKTAAPAPGRKLPLLCLIVLMLVGLWPGGVAETSRDWLFDAYQRLLPAVRPGSDVVIIDVDAESIRRIGQWPWPRDQLARLIDAAAAARVIGIDLLLGDADRSSPPRWAEDRPGLAPEIRRALQALPSSDDALAASFARVPVVLSALAVSARQAGPADPPPVTPILEQGVDPRPTLTRADALLGPLPVFAGAARGVGIVSVPPEPDGVLRRVPAIVAVGDALVPSLGLEVVRVAVDERHLLLRSGIAGQREIRIADRAIRTDLAGRLWPHYADAAQERVVPAHRILSGDLPPGLFDGKVVLLGSSAAGLGDVVVTPLRRPMSGIAAQAQIVAGLLAGDGLWRPVFAQGGEILGATALGLCAILLLGRIGDRRYAALFGGLATLLVVASWLAFAYGGLLIDWTFPLGVLAATMLLGLAARVGAQARARREHEAQLETALIRAETADRAKTEFLATISHELRTPLTAIIGFSEMMATEIMGAMPATYLAYARDINRSGSHLLSVINGVLDLTVLDLGGARPGTDRIVLESAVRESGQMVAAHAAARPVTVQRAVSPDLPELIADARMVKQMLVNLLSNAIKYSPAGGEIQVRAERVESWLCVVVQDAGPGIPDDEIPYVLQRFGRLKSARLAQEPGVGIGLPLTQAMVELHGGRLEIRSEVGVGTEVVLWFPPSRLVEAVPVP